MIRSIRFYSDSKQTVFLSDLLARIEKINLNKNYAATKSEKPGQKTKSQVQSKGTKPKAKPQPKERNPKIAGSSFTIKVADHPLFNNFQGGLRINSGPKKQFTPRTNSSASNNNKMGQSNPSKPNANRPNSNRPKNQQPRRLVRGANSSDAIELVSKTVQPKEYKPSLTNQFLEGKSTNFQIDLTSRITSVIKSQLIQSKYPYLLPKSIIESAPKSGNKFLVQNLKYDISSENLNNDINTIIRGKSIDNLADDSIIARTLNKNPDLNLASKQSIFDVIHSKSLANTFDKAHWRS